MGSGRHRRPPAWSAGWLACAVALALPGAGLLATAGGSGPAGALPASAASPEPAPAVARSPAAAPSAAPARAAAGAAAAAAARVPAAVAEPAERLRVVANPAVLTGAADPVRVRVPRLGITAGLAPLALGARRELVPPPYGVAGWYRRGPEPGEAGRAVVAGHVDSRTGPDVFYNLRNARRGDRVVVDLADGTRVVFTVQRVATYPKERFPTASVYGGPRKVAELRLITCGGEYVRSRGGYQDNVVVFAVRS